MQNAYCKIYINETEWQNIVEECRGQYSPSTPDSQINTHTLMFISMKIGVVIAPQKGRKTTNQQNKCHTATTCNACAFLSLFTICAIFYFLVNFQQTMESWAQPMNIRNSRHGSTNQRPLQIVRFAW